MRRLTRGQAILMKHQEWLGRDASNEDLHLSMNRHERRVIQAEARCYARAKAKKEALKRKRQARKMVEL